MRFPSLHARMLPTLVGAALLGIVSGCASPDDYPGETLPAVTVNTLTEAEVAEGWLLLFDGKTFAGWRGLGREGIPEGHWIIEEGTLRKVASGEVPTAADGQPLVGGDLMTVEAFSDFTFSFEWKISEGGNSGVKYNVSEAISTSMPPDNAALGFEYQILDDERHPDAANGPNRTAGALYDMIPPDNKTLMPVGSFNRSSIIFRGNRGEHWLNGQMVVSYDLGSPRFDSLMTASKYRDIPDFAVRRGGHLVLQDHSDDVWFRNLKIRLFPNP